MQTTARIEADIHPVEGIRIGNPNDEEKGRHWSSALCARPETCGELLPQNHTWVAAWAEKHMIFLRTRTYDLGSITASLTVGPSLQAKT